MLEVTVKTLDSQNHSFSVPDEITVKEFKDEIAPVLNIAADKQRLIFCGKILKDDKKLSEYDVNGKVIHVVQSLPPSQGNNSSSNGSTSSSSTTNARNHRDAAGFLLGAFTIPQDLVDPAQVQNIVQDVVSGMGEIGRNATVMSRASDDGSVDVHINLGRVPVQVPLQSEAQLRMNRVRHMLNRAEYLLGSIEVNINETPGLTSGPERFRFEGLAHAAQAAISAAFATAAAAARAATASVATPATSTAGTTAPLGTEPMDATPSENVPDFLAPLNIAPDPTVIAMDSLPSDSESPAQEPAQTESESASESDSNSHHPDCPLSSTRTPPSNGSASSSRRAPALVQPSVQTLANLLDDVMRINNRMQPCLEKCRDLIRTDPALSGRPLVDAHRLFSRVSQLMHFVSHAYHNLSDLHINFSQAPPRSPLVRIISSAHSPSLFQGIPMQAQISITTSSGILPNSSQSTTTTTANNANNDATRTATETRPVPAPRISQAPLITSVSSSTTSRSPLFVQRSQNPVVFMEVSPTSLTIDSISSLVPPSSSSAPTSDTTQTPTSTTAASSTTRDASSQSNEATDTQSSSPRVSAPNAAPSSTGQVPPLNIPFRNIIPVPLTSMGSLHTFDSGLPCHSVWALEPSRRRHNAGNARSQPNAQPTVNPNAPGRQEDQLQQVISNIMMSLINHAPAQGAQAPPGVTVFTSRGDDSGPRDGSALFNAIREVTQEASRAAMRQNAASTASTGSTAPSSTDAYNETLALLNTSQMSNMKLAEILVSIDFRTEGVLGDLVVLLANQFTLKDILDISYGKYACLDRIRRPLQMYLECNVLFGEDPSATEVDAGVKQISSEILNTLQSFVSGTRSRCGMDYSAALSTFIHQSVHKLLVVILDKSESAPDTFRMRLVRMFQKISREFLALNEKYSFNANSNFEEFAREIIEPLTSGIGQSYHEIVNTWIMNSIRRFMITFGPDASTESQIPASNSSQSNRTDASQKKTDEPKSSSPEPTRPARNNTGVRRRNFVEALGVNEALASGLTGTRSAPTLAAFARIAEQTSALLRNNAQPSDIPHPPTRNLREMVLGSDPWHNSVPPNWVPIIARDVQRQRRQAAQTPFSNAYLSGMPSKRRKIMTNGNPTLLESSKSALSEMLLQAISSANVKPVTNIEELKKDALQNSSLQTSFNKHMKNAIQERLQRDLDYCSERFPNSEKYFN
ncbi:unnamed protein product [Larinioides sclopetarius]|uniref:BCL2-associated athanogene 6 n=1 Tax=Larinioides sclopetarius TaxID=280406 RepID=A0AAV2B591_9ARAC